MTPRRCTAPTKSGKPCGAYPLKDSDPPRCLAHADAETRRSVGFVSDNGLGGRPKLPKPTELARQLVERHAAAVLRPHFKALGLLLADDGTVTPLPNGAIHVHQGEATKIEDLGAQIAAARELLDRVYGKPKQAVEHTGQDGGPIRQEVRVPSEQEWHADVARVLADAGALEAHAGNGNGNGAGPDPG